MNIIQMEAKLFCWLVILGVVLFIMICTGAKAYWDYSNQYLHTVEGQEEASKFYEDNCLDRTKWANWNKKRIEYFQIFCDEDQHSLAIDPAQTALFTLLSGWSIQNIAQIVGDMSKVGQFILLGFSASVLGIVMLLIFIAKKLDFFKRTPYLPIKED